LHIVHPEMPQKKYCNKKIASRAMQEKPAATIPTTKTKHHLNLV